jgi:hypothetical protein
VCHVYGLKVDILGLRIIIIILFISVLAGADEEEEEEEDDEDDDVTEHDQLTAFMKQLENNASQP